MVIGICSLVVFLLRSNFLVICGLTRVVGFQNLDWGLRFPIGVGNDGLHLGGLVG